MKLPELDGLPVMPPKLDALPITPPLPDGLPVVPQEPDGPYMRVGASGDGSRHPSIMASVINSFVAADPLPKQPDTPDAPYLSARNESGDTGMSPRAVGADSLRGSANGSMLWPDPLPVEPTVPDGLYSVPLEQEGGIGGDLSTSNNASTRTNSGTISSLRPDPWPFIPAPGDDPSPKGLGESGVTPTPHRGGNPNPALPDPKGAVNLPKTGPLGGAIDVPERPYGAPFPSETGVSGKGHRPAETWSYRGLSRAELQSNGPGNGDPLTAPGHTESAVLGIGESDMPTRISPDQRAAQGVMGAWSAQGASPKPGMGDGPVTAPLAIKENWPHARLTSTGPSMSNDTNARQEVVARREAQGDGRLYDQVSSRLQPLVLQPAGLNVGETAALSQATRDLVPVPAALPSNASSQGTPDIPTSITRPVQHDLASPPVSPGAQERFVDQKMWGDLDDMRNTPAPASATGRSSSAQMQPVVVNASPVGALISAKEEVAARVAGQVEGENALASLDGATPLRAAGSASLGAPGAPGAMPPSAGLHVARQVAQALQGSSGQSFEITLSPAELGKVRISLSPGDNGLSVAIFADRPETLDLMRRNAESLAQEFREIGQEAASFSFSSGDSGGDRDQAAWSNGADGRVASVESALSEPVQATSHSQRSGPTIGAAGMDLRF
ncbi:MAG: flagellar hook-length control protein FliK [Roseovarius sp.]